MMWGFLSVPPSFPYKHFLGKKKGKKESVGGTRFSFGVYCKNLHINVFFSISEKVSFLTLLTFFPFLFYSVFHPHEKNPSSSYKQKYMFCNLTYMLIRFRLGYKNIDIKRRLRMEFFLGNQKGEKDEKISLSSLMSLNYIEISKFIGN